MLNFSARALPQHRKTNPKSNVLEWGLGCIIDAILTSHDSIWKITAPRDLI